MKDATQLVADQLAAAAAPCMTSSFQAECVVLLHMLREIQPRIPVLFLDTVHHFAQTLAGRIPLHAEASLVVPFDLRAEAENEPAPRVRLQIPRDVREDHRAAWKCDGDRCAERYPSGRGRGRGERQKGIVLRFDRPQAVEAHVLGNSGVLRRFDEVSRLQHRVDLHAGFHMTFVGIRAIGDRWRTCICGWRSGAESPI